MNRRRGGALLVLVAITVIAALAANWGPKRLQPLGLDFALLEENAPFTISQ